MGTRFGMVSTLLGLGGVSRGRPRLGAIIDKVRRELHGGAVRAGVAVAVAALDGLGRAEF